tara:strand:+ start:17626 stop:19668 length:2043 start_codon:yes stop_codon:yes gene_type:complete
MARIDAGGQFGRDVAPATNLASVPTPRAAFGSTQSMDQAGQQVMNEGLRQERQQLHEADMARKAADRLQAQAQFYTYKDRLDDAMKQLGSDIQQGAIDKTKAANEWNARSKDILAGALDGVPDREREAVGLELQTHAQRITSKVGDLVRERDQQDVVTAINTTLEYTQRLAVTDPEMARSIVQKTLAAAGPFSGLKPDQLRKAEQGWVEETAYTRAFTAVNAAKSDNKALSTVEQGLAQNTDLDPQRKAALLAQIDGYRANNEARAIREAQRAEIAAQRAQRESSQAFSVLSSWALSGKAANPDANASLVARLTPADREAYKALAAEVPMRAAAAMLPLDTQQQQIDTLKAQRNQFGTDQRLEQEINRREQVLNDARREYQQDPLRAAQERGILDQPLQPLRTDSIDGLVSGMAVRVQQAQTTATRVGRPVSPLLSEEAGRLGDMLNALAPAQRSRSIASLAAVMPPSMAQALAEQMNDKDRATALAFSMAGSRTTNNRFASELLLRGAQAKKDGTSTKGEKEPALKAAQWQANIAAQLEGVFPQQTFTDQARDAAVLVAHGIAAEQGGALSKDDLQRAVRLAIGGSLEEVNGRRVPIPAGFSRADLEKRLRTVSTEEIRAQAGPTVRAAGAEIPVAEFVKRLPAAELMPMKPGQYVVLAEGRPVVSPTGRPVVIGLGVR